ncbi:NACHT domain-containing protein [Streptomyces geranii]|uniref:NACHT domain-containing protein n=1 Tax=Streptomyces geranii TaxID=2058923 RepID=UPI00130047A2|nr:NACHT domain-containing protein [Streptomyces geranii]
MIAAYGLLGERVPWLSSLAAPERMLLEADVHVDDIAVDMADGSHVFIQAKNSGDRASLTAALKQWCAAIRAGECTAVDEVLLVVGQKWTDDLMELAQALDARRGGASLTSTAQLAVDELKVQAVRLGLTEPQADLLLGVAKIKQLEADENGRDEALGAACLNAAIVTAGHGLPAFQAMRARLKDRAKTRTPSDVNMWRQWLTDAALPLTADAGGALAARLQAEDDAVAAYRRRWAQKQDVLPLADLGLNLTSLDVPGLVEDLRATPLHAPDTEIGTLGNDLVSIVRRQGQLLLVGRPGMGKSVALRLIAAAWASQPNAPVPVWLRLRDLQVCLPVAGPYRLRIDDVVQVAADTEYPSLRAGLARRIEAGEVLLLLDALDEVHERQGPVVEALAALIGDLPSTIDVVVTSRHSSVAAASVLQLPCYELGEPSSLEQTARVLLEELSMAGDDSQKTQEQWISERTQRIGRSRESEADLWRVPLLAMLMVLTIARRPLGSVPNTRAGLLVGVLRDSVHRWDFRRPDAVVPGMDSSLAGDPLLDCYQDIAHLVIAGDPPWDEAKNAVEHRLRHHWGLAPGVAASGAEKIVDYWDATAGVFITHTHRGALNARVRLFAEIGEVQWVVRDTTQLQGWMTSVLHDADRYESARLAASLSPAAADELIRWALHVGDDALDLVYDALDDGAVFVPTALTAVRDAQLDRLPTIKEPDRAKGVTGFLSLFQAPPAAQLAIRLADDDLTCEQTDRLIAATAKLGSHQAAVVEALCACRTARKRGTALTAAELDTVATALYGLPSGDNPEPVEENLPRLRLAGIEPLIRAALIHLLPSRPDIAPALATAARSYTTTGFCLWLTTELDHLGFAAAARAMTQPIPSSATIIMRWADERAALFRLLGGLAEPRPVLAASEAWHLNDAAAFVATLGIAKAMATVPDQAVQQHRNLTERLCRATLDGTGLAPDLVAAQLQSLDSENDPDWGLLFKHSTRLLPRKVQPSTVDTDLILEALHTGNPWLAQLSLRLTDGAQSVPSSLPQQLAEALAQIPAVARVMTATLLTLRWPLRSLPTQDPVIRAGIARVKAQQLASQHQHRDASAFLCDVDLLVREKAVDGLTDIPAADRSHLEAALAVPARQWTCVWCGTLQSVETDACPNRHSRPHPKLAQQRV